jgi:hypothetical protein
MHLRGAATTAQCKKAQKVSRIEFFRSAPLSYIPRSALVVIVKVFGQLLPQHFISFALMTEYYSAFEQSLLDVFGKIAPKIDDRRAHDAGKPVIPLVQDGRLGRLYLDRKIYCSVPSRCIRSPIQGCFRRVFCPLHYLGLLAFRRLALTLFSTTVTDGRNGMTSNNGRGAIAENRFAQSSLNCHLKLCQQRMVFDECCEMRRDELTVDGLVAIRG